MLVSSLPARERRARAPRPRRLLPGKDGDERYALTSRWENPPTEPFVLEASTETGARMVEGGSVC